MTRQRRPHTAHRFRVISRCPTCGSRLLSGCSYKSRRGGFCIATRDDRPRYKGTRIPYHECYRNGVTFQFHDRVVLSNVPVVDLTREARRIFGDMLAPGIGIGVGE